MLPQSATKSFDEKFQKEYKYKSDQWHEGLQRHARGQAIAEKNGKFDSKAFAGAILVKVVNGKQQVMSTLPPVQPITQ